jgi:hypothetical protein
MYQSTQKNITNLTAIFERFQNHFISSKLIQQTSSKYLGTSTNNLKQDLNKKTTFLCIKKIIIKIEEHHNTKTSLKTSLSM